MSIKSWKSIEQGDAGEQRLNRRSLWDFVRSDTAESEASKKEVEIRHRGQTISIREIYTSRGKVVVEIEL